MGVPAAIITGALIIAATISGQFGLKKLIEHIWMLIGMASACRDMAELRQRMAEKFGRERIQLTLYLPPPAPGDRA